ncbi:MAG TPA: hypothetical protein PK819_06320, partial [Thermomicrobiales bacterium]|nr:hypothetical protein [Thermomicrobiales bacterium]
MDDTMDFGSLSAEDAPMIGSPAEVPTEPRRYLADLIGLGSALTLCLFVLIANVTNHYALSRLDILTFYIPWYEHLGDRLRHFDIPGWLPFTMSGVPFAGDPQSGWGYLPAMISFAIAPSNTGYVIYLVFHMVLACAGAYLF